MIDNERPFAPLHGPGEDPYTIHEFRDEIDFRTDQYGFITPKGRLTWKIEDPAT